MTRSMQASLTAIGRQLNADYQPTLAKPLPTELKDLVARLVALDYTSRDRLMLPSLSEILDVNFNQFRQSRHTEVPLVSEPVSPASFL